MYSCVITEWWNYHNSVNKNYFNVESNDWNQKD